MNVSLRRVQPTYAVYMQTVCQNTAKMQTLTTQLLLLRFLKMLMRVYIPGFYFTPHTVVPPAHLVLLD